MLLSICVQNIDSANMYGKSISKCISETCVFNLKNVFTYTFSLQLPFCMPYLKYLFFQFYCLLHILCRRQTYGFMYLDFFVCRRKSYLNILCYANTCTQCIQNIKTSLLLIVSFLLKSSFLFALRRSTATTEIVLFMVYGVCVFFFENEKDFHVNRTSSVQSKTKLYNIINVTHFVVVVKGFKLSSMVRGSSEHASRSKGNV